MDTHRLTTENNNINKINKNIFHASLPTIINISNDDACINNNDPLLNKHDSTNVLSNLPDSCNLEERDENKLPFPDFVETAVCFLQQTTPPRYQCLKLITWSRFDLISMFVILINCITLGMHQPCAHQSGIESSKKCDTTFCICLQTIDYCVFAFFTIEMCLKMIAMGIFGKKAYLAESWNRLDCFIVLTGLAELLIPGDYISLSAIRTVRVLRPLRTINRVPSMRIIVTLLLDTLPMLGNVLLLCFFVFFIFGVVGVQLWKGLLRNRCFLELNTTIIVDYSLFGDFLFEPFYIPPDQTSFICSGPSSSGMTKCSDIPRLRQDNKICDFNFDSLNLTSKNQTINGCINWNQYYRSCATSDQNPFSGSISFDNIFSAWLAIFQIITCEGWVTIMYYVQDAHSFWDWIYFVSLIVIGSFFMMNLCLAVISAQFGLTKRRETERMLAEQKRLAELNPTAVTNDRSGSCCEEIVKYVKQLSKRLYKRLFCKNYRQKSDKVNHRHTRKETTTKDVLTSNINIVSSTPLIDQKHRSNCPHYQCSPLVVSTTIDCGYDTYEIGPDIVDSRSENNNSSNENNRRINETLEFERLEQQIDRNYVCDCYDQDKGVDTSENSQDENSNVHRGCICCCCSFLMPIQKFIARIVANKYFNHIIFSAIIINTLSMTIEYHGQPESLTNALEYSNYVFLILFAIEMLFKIIAGGIFKYISNPLNIFDGSIVIISFIELYGQGNSGLSVLRTFRLLRVIKIVRFLPALRRQLIIMIKTLDNVAAFLGLLILFIFIFSVLGIHIFGGEFSTLEAFNTTSYTKFDIKCRCCACAELSSFKNLTDIKYLKCETERANFDSLPAALLTVFQILTQEDWNEVLYNGMEKTSPWSALYFIGLIIICYYILVNLLIAIFVEGFSNEGEDEPPSSKNKKAILDVAQLSVLQELVTNNIQIPDKFDESESIKLSNEERQAPDVDTIHRTNSHQAFSSSSSSSTGHFIVHEGNLIEQESNNMTNTCLNSVTKRRSTVDNSSYSFDQTLGRQRKNGTHTESNTSNSIQLAIGTEQPINDQKNDQLHDPTGCNAQLKQKTEQPKAIPSCLNRLCGRRISEYFMKRENYALYLFSPSNRLRTLFQQLMLKKSFDYFILFVIALNCITLAMERPSISPSGFERQFLNLSSYIFTAIFTVEMIIKVIASGLLFGSNTYLHTGWNVMDGFIVIISVVDVVAMHRGMVTPSAEPDAASHILSMLRVFRLLRALRPLTVIHRAPGLQLVVRTLILSLRSIGQVVIICCIFFIIFGILGVQLFKGKFYFCEGSLADSVETKQQCESMPNHRWQNHKYNFDNLGQAVLTLFILASKDGWVEIMYNAIDAVDVDVQPIRNYSEAKLIYFISFILIVSFFVVNMFVGVIIENFQNCRAQQELEEAGRDKKKYEKILERKQSLLSDLSYYSKMSRCRKRLYDICITKYFDLIIAGIIGLNVVTMSLEYYSMPHELEKFLEYCNYVFTVIFLLEFIWKIIAFGPVRYFREKWNQLDSFIVLVSVASVVIEHVSHGHILPINPTLIRVIRVLRIARVLKLLKMAKGIQTLLDTIMEALPQVGNLSLLFLLIFFIFATLGVELFGKLECSEEQPCTGLNQHAHFKNFGIALLTLFRVATGDNWNGIMKDTLRHDDSHPTGRNRLMIIISSIYFVIFVLMTQFVLLNIVVAVLMKKLEDSNAMIEQDATLGEEMGQLHDADVHHGSNAEQSLLDMNGPCVKEKVIITNL
ncbi:unnamed protein product [Rotaria magnacalcarata]|nr:unnamed protein product [Rotaria magnacalcarata]